jgi:hypothetical protein
VVLWSVDLKDFRARDAADLQDRLDLCRLGPGDIVLYHGTGEASAAALPALLEAVRGSGLPAVTVSEMLER